ncbi:MAG TPA: protein translocase subunit SecD [Dehalococcoidia bacterium]|nr:protein translocase subunit SecD [Dehalococcoidia bacterium]
MRRNNNLILMGIIILAALALWVVWPRPEGFSLAVGGSSFERKGLRLGLDLQGGTSLVMEGDLSKVELKERDRAMDGVARIIDRRINAYGVAEASIQRQGANRILVQLPGVRDVQEAVRLIGKTAQLDFREQVPTADGNTEWVVAQALGSDNQQRELTGKYFLPRSQVTFDDRTGQPQVAFEFDSEGGRLFEQITTRLVGKPLGIFLDNELISAPTVRDVIKERGVINNIPLEEARLLAIQLNAGALPIPVGVVKQQDVDATLGADSLEKSLLAGEIGLAIVALFMLIYYRVPGLLADIALLVYSSVTLAVFQLIPVTLSLAGIAGFILSIGMAVDANILIFERTKEEVRSGRTLGASIEAGFSRAWTSIRDSNISTLITCAILFWFGSNFGASIVTGFAVTLALGVLISMFTAIIVTRTFLRTLVSTEFGRSLAWFGLERAPAPRPALGATGE